MGFIAGIVIAGAILMSAAVALCGSFPTTLVLERAFPVDHRVPLSQLRARDRVRHGRMLQTTIGIADFPVEGTFDPFRVGLVFSHVGFVGFMCFLLLCFSCLIWILIRFL